MMIQEFEKLTGLEVNAAEYKLIEEMYYEFDGDKQAFCKKFMKDNAIVEVVRMIATGLEAEKHEALSELKLAREKAAKLEDQLEREQEWKPYIDTDNYPQERYDELRKAGRVMTDDEAKEILYDWYGFAKEKITILHSVPKFEVNRHRQLRKVGEIERLPLYEATDWNYIRFDCGCMRYELVNDQLRPWMH